MDETADPAEPTQLADRVLALLGRQVPVDSEAWSCAAESLHYRGESEASFDLAETMPAGIERDAVLQQAHDSMSLAEDWEQQARAEAADLPEGDTPS